MGHRNKFYTIDGVEFEGSDSASFSSAVPLTDDSVQDLIYERLLDSMDIEAGQIEVSVHEGAVTLEGVVMGPQIKLEAEKIVRSIANVKAVTNNLRPFSELDKPFNSNSLKDDRPSDN